MHLWFEQTKPTMYETEWNMYAANPRFARGESRISFGMLKSLPRVQVVGSRCLLSKTTNPKTLNPKLKP